MKGLIWLALVAIALRVSGLIPFSSTEIADLLPVQTLTVDVAEGQVKLDAGECTGQGDSWQTALEDLRQGAEGIVFLGTAEQVVLTQEATELLPEVVESGILRPGAVVCACPGELPAPKEITEYLSAHNGGVTLRQVQSALLEGVAIKLPVLVETEGGLRLYGQDHG